jgi:outer membrane protein OmpA-like peptidoglycan-associated protein
MRRFAALMLIALAAASAAAQKYKESDPIPPGATGKILPIRGEVLQIRGLSSAVAGKSESLTAALADLGATRVGTEVHIALASDVLFDFDKAVLRPEAAPALENVALVIQSFEHPQVTVEGHSDNVGADAYNQALSERRARAVQSWLASRNRAHRHARLGRIEARRAEYQPDGTDSAANRQKNRRVEIVVKMG